MSVLRFRIMYEDDETIYRDVEILSSQSLRQFVEIIRGSFGIAPDAAAHLFTGNDQWHKVHPLPLDAPAPRQAQSKADMLAALPLIKFIFDPHQRFIFELDETAEQLLIELNSISDSVRSDIQYPISVRSNGASPFRKEEPIAVEVPRQASGASAPSDEDFDDSDDDAGGGAEEDMEDEELGYDDEDDELPSGDLMEGDALVEADEDAGDPDAGMGDEFFDEDFGDADVDLDDDDELR